MFPAQCWLLSVVFEGGMRKGGGGHNMLGVMLKGVEGEE